MDPCEIFNFVKKYSLVSFAFSGRQEFPVFDHFRYGGYRYNNAPVKGVVLSEGQGWAEQRRFALRNLRDFGFGKSSMSELILEEINKFADSIRPNIGKPMSLKLKFNLSVINALWKITSGTSYKLDDAKLNAFMKQMDSLLRAEELDKLSMMAPSWLVKLLPDSLVGIANFENKFLIPFREEVHRLYMEHKESFDGNDLRDFTDIFIKEMEETSDPKSSFYKEEGMKNYQSTILDLFLAGTETTTTTLIWMFYYLCMHPDIQDKARQDIFDKVGKDRPVMISDRKDCQNVTFRTKMILEYI